jgi:5-methylcytosine-specific restriction protein A
LSKGRVVAAEEIHHIVPLNKGGTNERSNLMPICRECHRVITTGRPRIGVDGYPET